VRGGIIVCARRYSRPTFMVMKPSAFNMGLRLVIVHGPILVDAFLNILHSAHRMGVQERGYVTVARESSSAKPVSSPFIDSEP
jgi:hypothetical protein